MSEESRRIRQIKKLKSGAGVPKKFGDLQACPPRFRCGFVAPNPSAHHDLLLYLIWSIAGRTFNRQ